MSLSLKEIKLIGDEIPWLKDFRNQGQSAFLSQGIPTAKTEEWKFTKPNRFLERDFTPVSQGQNVRAKKTELPFDCYKICFENGVFDPCNSDLPQGVEVIPLIEAVMFQTKTRDKVGSITDISKHPFAALNSAYLNEGVYIRIDTNVDIIKPIVLVYHVSASDNSELYNLRNVVEVAKKSSVNIVEYYYYDGDIKSSYLTNVVNEMFVSENAKLKHYKIQDEAYKAGHLSLTSVSVDAGGHYKSFCLQKGADLSRNETKVFLTAENASTEVDAAYIMNGWATLDTTTDIEHLKPHTYSSQLVKGVVGGQAKGVFQGKIHIAPDAVKTEGYQLHKAMLLTNDAEIDVKPELEIFADDVKCSHGSACGQLDAEQLFYMRSRGIKEDDAKQLLIEAYLNDVIAKVDDENICNWIKSLLDNNLSD